jgi:hypothetical protein
MLPPMPLNDVMARWMYLATGPDDTLHRVSLAFDFEDDERIYGVGRMVCGLVLVMLVRYHCSCADCWFIQQIKARGRRFAMTLDDVKTILLAEVGAGLEGMPDRVLQAVLDQVSPYIDLYWEAWRWKAFYPGLQALYVKRQCLDVLLGQNRDRLSVSIAGASVPQNQIFDSLMKLRDYTQKEIERVEGIAAVSRHPALGTMAGWHQVDAYGRVYSPYGPSYPGSMRIV